jgi:long-chain acyl-CoA synthetase
MSTDFLRRARAAGSFCELFQDNVRRFGDDLALRSAETGEEVTWRQYGERVRRAAAALAGLGVARGDTVGLMLTNRVEFHVYDAAAMHLGAIPFSIYNTSTVEQIRYLLSNAENRILVTEPRFADVSREAGAQGRVEHLICLDEERSGFLTVAQLEQRARPDFDFDAAWRAVTRDDVLTVTYTSGTTGPPKGVETTHGGGLFLIEQVLGDAELAPGLERGTMLSYLPDAHLGNRCFGHYAIIAAAGNVTTLRDIKQLASVLPVVRPTLFLGAPTLWYKIRAGIERGLAAERGVRGRLARWAVGVGQAVVRTRQAGDVPALPLRLRHAVADRLVLATLRRRFGMDRTALPISSTAPIARETLEFILGLGIPLCEGWGMSETCATGTVNRPSAIRAGTVGRPFSNVELCLAEDGELLYRSAGLMRGYRNEPGKTADAIDADGWLHTGDVATIDADGYVRIVDRKKELIITASGKNMSPSNIENAVRVACPLVGSVVAVGDNRPYIVALLALDPDATVQFGEQHGVDLSDPGVAAGHPLVLSELAKGIAAANANLSRVEHVRRYCVVPSYWQPGGDELTPTMKLKRRPIVEKYATQIEALYSS